MPRELESALLFERFNSVRADSRPLLRGWDKLQEATALRNILSRGSELSTPFQHLSNPHAPGTFSHPFAFAILEIGRHAKGKKRFYNLPLRIQSRRCARSTASRVLHREVK